MSKFNFDLIFFIFKKKEVLYLILYMYIYNELIIVYNKYLI